ncbi:MAG: pilin [bacterium]|nr:pilin [bacterium]
MKTLGIAALSFALPSVVAAQVTENVTDLNGVIRFITDILSVALPLIIAAAVVYFIYGIAKYVLAGDEGAKEAAKDKIVYGIIALFVMVSVWGLVNILVNSFGLDNTAPRGNTDPLNNLNLPR